MDKAPLIFPIHQTSQAKLVFPESSAEGGRRKQAFLGPWAPRATKQGAARPPAPRRKPAITPRRQTPRSTRASCPMSKRQEAEVPARSRSPNPPRGPLLRCPAPPLAIGLTRRAAFPELPVGSRGGPSPARPRMRHAESEKHSPGAPRPQHPQGSKSRKFFAASFLPDTQPHGHSQDGRGHTWTKLLE